MDLNSAASRYEDFYIIEKGLSVNTSLGYRSDLNLFITHLHQQGVQNTEGIRDNHILGFLNQRISQVNKQTLNREKSVIKNFLIYHLSMGEMSEDFSRLLAGDSGRDFLPSILTQGEIARLFQAIEKKKDTSPHQRYLGERDHLMLEMLYALGLRVSELTDIRITDIDTTGWCRIHGKGDKIRIVPLLPQILEKISDYLKHTHPYFLSSSPKQQTHPHNPNDKSPLLFLNKHGKRLSRIAVWKRVKGIALKAGINKNIYPHTFRHTCATHLLQNGADLRMIQELVGHSSIQTTEIYTHLLTDDIKETFANHHPLYQ